MAPNSTSNETLHGEENKPSLVDEENGGFNYTTTVFPSDFTCEQTLVPSNASACNSLKTPNYSCCFVKTKISGKLIDNFCVAMNATNLPAIDFVVKNHETESIYGCESSFNHLYFLDIILLVVALF